jgi:lactoylglutathione lyase
MAFVGSPDKQSIELLQNGEPLLPAEPWKSMPARTGPWARRWARLPARGA